MSKYGVFSGPYFPAFGLNREEYGVPYYTEITSQVFNGLKMYVIRN